MGTRKSGCAVPIIVVLALAATLYTALLSPPSWQTNLSLAVLSPASNSEEPGTPVCTTAVFRDHYARKGYFPSGGSWVGKDETARYEPDICRFRPLSIQDKTLKKCLSRKNISSIVMLGASQGKKYSVTVKGILQETFKYSRSLKSEHKVDRVHEASYFADGDQYILDRLSPQPSHCVTCVAYKVNFYDDDVPQNVTLEYFGMDDLVDSTLRLYVRDAREKSIETYQEFLFRHYLASNPPDLVIISPALNHAKFKSSPEKFAADLKHFRSMIEMYLPPTTKTLWLPGLSEREDANASNPEQYQNVRVDGLLASEAIDRLNHVMYDILAADLLKSDGLAFSFLDMAQVSAKCQADWWPSRVHLASIFYAKIVAHVLEYFCGDI